MLATDYNLKTIKLKFNEYLEKYSLNYTCEELDYIISNFEKFIYDKVAPDILMQIYEELGVEHRIGTFYQEHFNRIKYRFGLDRNILEIGSGKMPSFANKVACYQQTIQKGTITLYEPLLIIDEPKYPNMTLHKENFTQDTIIKDYDLLVGIFPCETTRLIIEKACQNNKDFYIAMCGCVHNSMHIYPMTRSIYRNSIINTAAKLVEENNMGELVIDKLPEDYEIDYPILHNKRH